MSETTELPAAPEVSEARTFAPAEIEQVVAAAVEIRAFVADLREKMQGVSGPEVIGMLIPYVMQMIGGGGKPDGGFMDGVL